MSRPAIAAGLLAEVIGLRATTWLAPLGGLLAAGVLWTSPVRVLRVLPEEPGGEAMLADAAGAALSAERDRPVGG